MSTITRTLRSALASTSKSGVRRYGFDASGAGPSVWRDEARNPVVRDSLVPIVVEQTVCFAQLITRRS